MPIHKGGKKNRKFGRGINRPSHKRYEAENRYLNNKKRKLAKHIKKFPNDREALAAYNRFLDSYKQAA